MPEQGFTLTSPMFPHGGLVPAGCTCDGEDVSPALEWMHVPPGTRSFVLIMDDPDAPRGNFTHWILFDIPATVTGLKRGETGIGVGGRNDFHHDHYGGPCPPPNHGVHRYFFTLLALDVDSLGLPQGASRGDVEQALRDHVLGRAQLMGRFERRAARL